MQTCASDLIVDKGSQRKGLAGEGGLPIVPARAIANISMRLVADQDPEECYQSLLRYLEEHAPPDVRWEARKRIVGWRASLVDRRSPGVRAMQRALHATWGIAPAFLREGGSVPVVSHLAEETGISSVICGFTLPDDSIHGPNERLHLPTWRRGIEAVTRFFQEAGAR